MRPAAGGATPGEAVDGFHPAFRVLLLLVLAAMLFRYSLLALALVLAVLLAAAAWSGGETLRGILKSLRRIRWLLLSIVVIYLWVAPEPGVAGRPGYLPSWSELDTALRRSGVLVVLVTAVELLRSHTGAPRMAAGLVLLLRPLSLAGVDIETFARRLALTLDSVPLTAERVARAGGRREGQRAFAGWGDAAAELVRDIERGAAGPVQDASLPSLAQPRTRDWGLLAAGVAACLLGSTL